MDHLNIDLETFSDVDIGKAGLYRYAESPAFRILLCSYSVNGGEVQLLDLTKGSRLDGGELAYMLFDPNVVKHAFNAQFEWCCLSHAFGLWGTGRETAWLSQWQDTQAHALYCGYPGSLEAAGRALGLPQDKAKLSTGKALIRYFCVPQKPTKANGGRTVNLPHHDPAKWELFCEYNRQDVVAEMEIERRLSRWPMPADVQQQWVTDARINARGVAVDADMVAAAQDIDAAERSARISEAVQISGLENPNSVSQLIGWMETETGTAVDNLTKATVKELLGGELESEKARRMLEIRQELSKTSNKKYDAISVAECADHRVRGILQFYGANRTGRWAGRIVQPQNLPRTYIDGDLLPMARDLVKARNVDAIRWTFGGVPDTLSQLIRTALVAAPGKHLIDADFSAIEARVIAWLAGEQWVLDVFRTHGKIYEATASTLYGVPIELIKKGNPEYALRQKGKAATLALGYGGGSAALITAGGLSKDTPEEELNDIKDRWRQANPAIVQFWYTCEAAAMAAVQTGRTSTIGHGITFAYEADRETGLSFLTIQLPVGRKLFYAQPHLTTNRFGRPSIAYMGINQETRKWIPLETYGGKLAENITQACARDCLAEAVERLEAAGYPVTFHIHDEVVVERAPEEGDLDRVRALMAQPPAWAPDLPLNAEGWTNPFFKKD